MRGLAKRTPKDKIVDRFLTLYIMSKSSEKTNTLGKTQLQKIVFLSEWKMISKRMKGLNYNYIKLLHGPYSQELQSDIQRISKLGEADSDTLVPTKRGFSVLEDFHDIIDTNRSFFEVIDSYTRMCTAVDLQSLLDHVYSLKHPMRRNVTIGKTPLRTPILYPLDESKAEVTFQISRDYLEDLAMSLDPEIVEGLSEGMEDVRNSRLMTHKEVFS